MVTSIPPALARSPLGFVCVLLSPVESMYRLNSSHRMLNDNMIEDIPSFNTPLVSLYVATTCCSRSSRRNDGQ